MELITPPSSAVPFGLSALAMIARAADGGLVDTHRALFAAIQRMALGTQLDVETLPEVEPDTLAEHFGEPQLARPLVRAMIVTSLAVGPTTPAQMDLIGEFARALEVDDPAVLAIERLAHRERVRFLLDFHRRSNLSDYIDNQYRTQGGFLAVVKGLLNFRGVLHDRALADRFHALADLPEDTLGRGLVEHYRLNGFAFPGEEGGFPVGAIFHDLGHVLAGYDATPEGELQIAAFQTGYRRTDDAFFTLLFAVLIHTAGVNVGPLPMPVHPGRIGEGDLAVRMIHAFQRGVQLTVDLGDGWDFWPYMELPLDEARRRLGVPALDREFWSGKGVYGAPIGRW